ncbi:MAG: hypothetical protein ABIO57_03375 [Candidatus Paceibacterota bacterium]
MAKPLKETPILTGKDAVNFYELQKAAKDKKTSASVVPGKPVQFPVSSRG